MPLPPMKALVAFEAAARLQNFTQAANELHLTHGAVSRQIALLEQHFGKPLFARLARGVALTDTGLRLYQTVQAMLHELSALSRELRDDAAAGEVRISITPAFGSHWLLPRLRRLNERYPQITVQLDASMALSKLDRPSFDFAVRYGAGVWPGIEAELLFRDMLTPVCRPELVDEILPLRIGDIGLPLLHDTNDLHWRAWLDAIGQTDLLAQGKATAFNDYNLVLEAALNGMGVAIGRTQLIADLLASGRLIAPFEERVASPLAYYLVKAPRALRKPAQAVWDWMLEAASNSIS